MFTSSSSVLFLILFGVFVRFMVVFVQFPTELSSFTGRTPESLPKSPSDHTVPTLVVALPLLLLSYTYFNYNFTVFSLATPPLLFWAGSQLFQWYSGSSLGFSCCLPLFCSLELSVCRVLCPLELVAARCRCRCVLVVQLLCLSYSDML